ncbi:glycoside hydrolase family 18 protein [Bacteroides sp.]|uniref:glycoside hydrolase family 18 protein n=1 Tax=Bacteroides sp. TaxID=29523 RepID=UPI0025C53BE6|nr:glycoside hydrolase family 18 protein [Bacteroides sp.]
MLLPRKFTFFLFLLLGVSLYAQQNSFISSYVRGNFYNRGRIAIESLRASDDLIFLNVHPNKDGSLSFENPRAFQGKGATTWKELIKSVRTKVKGTKVKIRLGASGGEWKAMVADEAARTAFAENIREVLRKNKLDGIDLDFEWAENKKEYEDYSLAILKLREVLGSKYLFSVSLHPVSYKISKEAIAAVDFISLQCYGPSPVRFPIEKYRSDIQMVLEYGIPKEKLVAGVPFYGVTKDNSKKTEAYFSFVQDGLITSPAENEVIYKGDKYVFDGQDNIRMKTRYAKEQGLKGMMNWDLATDLPLDNAQSLLKAMIEEIN